MRKRPKLLASVWKDLFEEMAGDLYPGRYTPSYCAELVEMAHEIWDLANTKDSVIVAHNYQYPELQMVADFVGDSLGLSREVAKKDAKRVDFSSVYFMGATAKIIVGDTKRVFVQNSPQVLGCSLVFGTDHSWLDAWKLANPGGVLVTYVNSDLYTKSISDYIGTSSNTAQIILRASREHPGKRILVLPDKFLGQVMVQKAAELAAEQGIDFDPDLCDVYMHEKKTSSRMKTLTGKDRWTACCYVHERIGNDAPERALADYPDAELLIHPECGCSSHCLFKVQAGQLPKDRVYHLSTEGMLNHARASRRRRFVVGTEKGMLFRLRRELPDKEFIPVSDDAVCDFMKQNTLETLLESLRHDFFEVILDDEADPRVERVSGRAILLNRAAAEEAKAGINRMLTT